MTSEGQANTVIAARNPIGVIGAGVIGSGIAQAFAQGGYDVILIDVSEPILDHARREITKNLRFQGLFKKSGAQPQAGVLTRIQFCEGYENLSGVGTLIENVTEKWEIKRELYDRIRGLYPSEALVAVNTSVISITRIAALTPDPGRTVGMHFMNPVPLTAGVELIRGHHTSPETVEDGVNLIASIGKQSIVVNDLPGFVSNRILMLTINEAIWVVQDQVAEPADVDRIFKLCFGHKMGPLETADLIGLDTILLSVEGLYESYRDSKFRPCPLLRKMVDAGLYGRKSGAGFYKYNE